MLVWTDHQQAIFFINGTVAGLAVSGESENGGAVSFHGE